MIKKAGLKPIISTIFHPGYPEEIEDILEISRKSGARLVINPAVKMGNWSGNKEIPVNENYMRVYRKLLKAPNVRWSGHINYPFESCPCGKEGIHITPYGDIVPCLFIPITYGNIKEESVEKIWKRMYANLLVSKMRHKGCIAGLDTDFISRYLEPINQKDNLPVSFSEHPGINR